MNNAAALLPFVLIVLVFWLLIMRPQRRRQQSLAQTQAALRVGTEVMLGSGIYGKVASVNDEDATILVEVSPGTVVKVARQAVMRIIDEPTPADSAADSGPDQLDRAPEDPDGGPDRPEQLP